MMRQSGGEGGEDICFVGSCGGEGEGWSGQWEFYNYVEGLILDGQGFSGLLGLYDRVIFVWWELCVYSMKDNY